MLAPDPRFDEIDGMEGHEFEAAVADLLRLRGFDQIVRNRGFDKGADIVAVKNGVRTAVQTKRWGTPVNLKAVRQLVDGVKRYGCARGLLVTNHYLTPPAIECAEEWGIEVWDRRELADWLPGEPPVLDTTVCAECGRPVTPGVTEWCLDHRAWYGGFVYCRRHQYASQRRAG